MKFSVSFRPETSGHIVNIASKALGLSALDSIRLESGVMNLSAGVVNPERTRLHEYAVNLSLKEETARTCGEVFLENYEARVIVNPSGLNKFCSPKYYQRTNEETGEILEAGYKMALDESQVLQAWLKSGAPLVWEID